MKTRASFFAIVFLLISAAGSFAQPTAGTLTGKWLSREMGPMAGGLVLLFNAETGPPPSLDGYLRVADAIASINNDGSFVTQAAPGRYYIALIKKRKQAPGPPQEGDLYFFGLDQNREPKLYPVTAGEKTDIGTIAETLPYHRGIPKSNESIAIIEGTVTDEKDLPVAGARVLAFLNPEMKGKPLYVSEATGADGHYRLHLSQGGTYYLKVRAHYGGGRPETGEIMGGYGEQSAPEVVVVETGKVRKGIDIKGKRFTGRGKRDLIEQKLL